MNTLMGITGNHLRHVGWRLLIWSPLNLAFLAPFFAPRIAGGKGEEKESRRQEDVARQREQFQNASNQLLAQLIPGSAEYQEAQELSRLGVGDSNQRDAFLARAPQLVQQQQARIAAGEPATAQQAATMARERQLRAETQRVPFEEDIFSVLTGTTPTTEFGRRISTTLDPTLLERELTAALEGRPTTTPTADVFAKPFALAKEPTREFIPAGQGVVNDEVFRNALKLVEDRVNQEAAGRGILGGGLRLEQLGRAGTEAAVSEALRQDTLRGEENQLIQERNRLQQEAFQNVTGLFGTAQAGSATLANRLANLFNVGEGLRGRDIGLEQYLTELQLGRETDLTRLTAGETSLRTTEQGDLLERQTGQSTADRLQQEADAMARRAAIGQALGSTGGQLIGSLFGPVGTVLGGNLGKALAPQARTSTAPASTPQTATELLGAQRAGTPTGGGPTLPALSRRPGEQLSAEDFAELLRQIGSGGSSADFSSRLRAAGL